MYPLFLEVKAAIYSVKKIVIQVLHVNIHAHRDSPLVLVYRDNQVEIYILPLMTECNMLHSNGRKFLSVFIVTESHRTVRGCHTRAQCRLCSSVLSRRSHDHGVSRPARSLRLLDDVFLPSRGLLSRHVHENQHPADLHKDLLDYLHWMHFAHDTSFCIDSLG